MTTHGTILDPWYAVICSSIHRHEPTDYTSEMKFSFKWMLQSIERCDFVLLVGLETDIPQNVFKLQQIREAMELFTVLLLVDNKAFAERFQHVTQSMIQDDRRWYPSWSLYVRGSATVQQTTWSSLFAFSDTSFQFQRAIEKLKVVGLEDTSMKYSSEFYDAYIEWACKFDEADVVMYTFLNIESNDIFNTMKTRLQRLFQAGAPLVKQLGLTGVAASPVDWWRNQNAADEKQVPMNITLSITIRDQTTTYSRVLAGLVVLPISFLEMDFNIETATTKMVAGLQLYRICPVDCSGFTIASIGVSLILNNVILTKADLSKIADVAVPWRRQSNWEWRIRDFAQFGGEKLTNVKRVSRATVSFYRD